MSAPSLPLVYLGAHQPAWLAHAGVPLFVSRVRLAGRKSLPRAAARWALDSGGFSELSLRGTWTVSPETYVGEVRRFRDEIGQLDWAAIQDWMCEPWITQKTGLSVAEHQLRTVQSYERLQALAPDLPWAPVLQGWTAGDYADCLELYERRGHDLRRAPIVGVGSICRRQSTLRAAHIIDDLAYEGLRLHGFGFKTQGLRAAARSLASADTLAWSFNARRNPDQFADLGCSHASCSNCLAYATAWLDELTTSMARSMREAS